mgnify:CR=1 FL=1
MDVFRARLSEYSSPDIYIAFGHFLSVDEELDKNVSGDIQLFAITIVLMMVYAGAATLTYRWVPLSLISLLIQIHLHDRAFFV